MQDWNRVDPLLAAMGRRGEASERHFAGEQERRFRVEAHRNRLVAEWAAPLLGKGSEESSQYIQELVAADLERPGCEDLIVKLIADFRDSGITVDEQSLRYRISAFEEAAWRQVSPD